MDAIEGSRPPAVARSAATRGASVEVDVYRALGTTVRLLARRLDCLLDGAASDDVREEIVHTKALADEVLDSLRRVTETLHPEPSGRVRLAHALRRLGREFTRSTGVPVDLRLNGPVHDLDEDVMEVLVALTCEAFLRVERHGRATMLLVSVSLEEERVVLDLRDDGIDLAQREAYDWDAGTRAGLTAMSELVKSFGGRLVVAPSAPRGVRLVAEVPRVPDRG